MPIKLVEKPSRAARPIHLVTKAGFSDLDLDPKTRAWAKANGFKGEAGKLLVLPGEDGGIAGAIFGIEEDEDGFAALATGGLARHLPEGAWKFAATPAQPSLAALGVALGGYSFTRYGKKPGRAISLALPTGADMAALNRQVDAVYLVRDLVNTPTNDMGPDDLETAVRTLAKKHKARVAVVKGDELLAKNFPMIHAVGRAADQAPRLIDLTWGPKGAPRVTLVGKGVCFDTGGLDIKSASNMLLMKKDMGGAANVLGLASMIMAAGMKVRLRVLIPAVENSISDEAFRPGDILTSRKGHTVEIGNTDAEGRLVLGDALALADEEEPELIIDMATLTGAARVAIGPEIAPFFTDDDGFAADVAAAGAAVADPVWRLPLWKGYDKKLSSKVADFNNVTTDGFAGAIVAAMFLKRFVERAKAWAHFDIYAWAPTERPHCPVGGEAQAIRAIEQVLARRYGS